MPIRDPRLTRDRAQERGYYPSTVTIEEPSATRSGSGESTETWAALAGHEDLVCGVVPAGGSAGGQRSTETRREEGTLAVESRVIEIKTYQPAITTKHRAVTADARAWDILAVDHDRFESATRLTVEARS